MKDAKVETTIIKAKEKLKKPHMRERNTDKDNEIFLLRSQLTECKAQIEAMKNALNCERHRNSCEREKEATANDEGCGMYECPCDNWQPKGEKQ
jgi:hypothetical protein